MPKYVCDFAAVKEAGKNICEAAENMSKDVQTFSSNIDSNLNTWSGSAKNSFNRSKEYQVTASNAEVERLTGLGEFIQQAAEAIEKTEEELASITI